MNLADKIARTTHLTYQGKTKYYSHLDGAYTLSSIWITVLLTLAVIDSGR